MHNSELNYCRVCGFREDVDLPWGADGKTASFTICSCCGVQHGYEDDSLDGVRAYREHWISDGCKWFCRPRKPENWSLDEQLANVPDAYR